MTDYEKWKDLSTLEARCDWKNILFEAIGQKHKACPPYNWYDIEKCVLTVGSRVIGNFVKCRVTVYKETMPKEADSGPCAK